MTGEVPPDDKNAPQDGELEPQDGAPEPEETAAADAGDTDGEAAAATREPSDADDAADDADDEEDEEDEEDDEDEEDEEDAAPAGATAATAAAATTAAAGRRRASRTPAPVTDARSRTTTGEEEIPYIDDRVSKIWVGAIASIFVLILLYGLLFGKSGMFSPPPPTDEPLPTDTPVPSLTAAPSTSPSASPSITIVPSLSAERRAQLLRLIGAFARANRGSIAVSIAGAISTGVSRTERLVGEAPQCAAGWATDQGTGRVLSSNGAASSIKTFCARCVRCRASASCRRSLRAPHTTTRRSRSATARRSRSRTSSRR